VIDNQSLAKGVLRLSQLPGQTLGQTCHFDGTDAAQIGLAFGVDMATAGPVTDAVKTSPAGKWAKVVFVPLVMLIILLTGPLQTPG